MPAQPHYNHYDDPDEFWDDEPIIRPAAAAPMASSASPSAISNLPPAGAATSREGLSPHHAERTMDNQALQMKSAQYHAVNHTNAKPHNELHSSIIDAWNLPGSPFSSMQVDRGLLPIEIKLDQKWDQRLQPNEYGTELVKAYDLAVSQELSRILSSQRLRPDGSLDLDCGTPDRRAQLIALLETPRLSDYKEKLDAMIAKSEYQVNGRILHSGEPVVLMTANRVRIVSINIRTNWGEAIEPRTLVDDLLSCADQIRRQRPNFRAWDDYSMYTISDLEYRHDNHVRTLIEQAYS